MSSDIVKRLRAGNTLDIGEAADLIETLEGELFESRKVCGETFDAARKWRAKAEALEGELSEANNAHAKTLVEFGNLKLRAERLRVALQGLYDDVDDYQRINNLSGYNNHWMVIARKALEDDKQ